jgi:hypothetical protein
MKAKQQPHDPKRVPGAYLVTPENGDDPTLQRSLFLVLGTVDEKWLLCEDVASGKELKLSEREVDALAYFRGPRCPDFPDDL